MTEVPKNRSGRGVAEKIMWHGALSKKSKGKGKITPNAPAITSGEVECIDHYKGR